MAVDLRSQIFQLKLGGGSHRGIAQQLGISPSKVARELKKRAPEVRADRTELGELAGGNGYHPGADLDLGQLGSDPMLADERQLLEREQLALRRAQIRSQRLEADRRAQILENPDSNGGGFATLVLQMLERQREETRAVLAQVAARQAAPAAPGAPSLTEQLTQFRQMADTVNSFAPPKAPSTAVDLEFKVAMERVNLEERRIATQLEGERAERLERAQSEARRNDAVAKAIEQFAGPAAAAIELWFQRQQPAAAAPPPQLPASNSEQPPPQAKPVVVNQNEVAGACPNCRAMLAIDSDRDEACPNCGTALAAAEGRIRVRLPNGELYPPLQVSN